MATAAATAAFASAGTHLFAHALAIIGRHLLPALALNLAHALPVLRWQLPPMLTHLVTHHPPLLRLQLGEEHGLTRPTHGLRP
jgi:hypothetical protein